MNLTTLETVLFYATVLGYFLSTCLFLFFFALKKEKVGILAGKVIAVSFAVHTLSLIVRSISARRLPLANQFEFATCFAWGIALCYLIFLRKRMGLGVFVAPLIFLAIGYAAMLSREINELMPALKSNWLVLHVSCAIISYGSFGVSAGISLLALLRGKINAPFFAKYLPDEDRSDVMSYRAICLGFLFLTLVIVTGAIWAQRAWGRYWTWDPKETWSLITWIIYALYLHLRLARDWRGKKAAMFSVIGFVCVIFTFIGVNTFIPSIHSYA